MTLPIHPLAELFQPLKGEAFDALVADIKVSGLHNCITLYEDKVLDGQNRLRACEVAGVEPQFDRYDGDDPLGFVLSMNLQRRHLDDSQRALIAAKIATFKRGGDRRSDQSSKLSFETSQSKAAKMLNVSRTSVQSASTLLKTGDAELIAAVEKGVIPVSRAVEALKPIGYVQRRDRERINKQFERRQVALAAMTPVVDEAAIEAWLKTAMDSQRGNIAIKAHNAIASKEERWRVIEALTGAKVVNRDDRDGKINRVRI